MGISIHANSSIDLSKTNQLMSIGKNNGNSIFDKQITKLQEIIKKIQEDSSLDAESKKMKIQEIEGQIKEIEIQRQAKQLEDQKKSLQKSKNNTSNDYTSGTGSGTSIGVTYELTKAVVEGDNAVKSINKTNTMRTNIINEIRITEGDDNSAPSKENKQSRLQKALARTTESLYKQIGETNGNVNQAGKKIAEANGAETENLEYENVKKASASNEDTTTSTESVSVQLQKTSSELSPHVDIIL